MSSLELGLNELFFVGKELHADHLNYAFLSAMQDIHARGAFFRVKSFEKLEDAGLLKEDLYGNIQISESLKAYLKPVFESKCEIEIAVYQLGEQTMREQYLLHLGDNRTVLSLMDGNKVFFQDLNEEELQGLIISLLPERYRNTSITLNEEIHVEKVERIIVVKRLIVGETYSALTLLDVEGWICRNADKEGE